MNATAGRPKMSWIASSPTTAIVPGRRSPLVGWLSSPSPPLCDRMRSAASTGKTSTFRRALPSSGTVRTRAASQATTKECRSSMRLATTQSLFSKSRVRSRLAAIGYSPTMVSLLAPHSAALAASWASKSPFSRLRHEATSRLFEAGFDIPEVSLVTGHKDWKMLRRYLNLRPHQLVGRAPSPRRYL